MEVKKRFKLYKSGKLWCCAAIAMIGVTVGMTDVYADSADNASSPTTSTVTTSSTASSAVDNSVSSNSSFSDQLSLSTPYQNTNNNVTTTTTLNVNQQVPVVSAQFYSTSAVATNNHATSANVVDVSAYQGKISTEQYQKYKSQGVNNVVVKLTEAEDWTNGCAANQVNNAKAAGLNVSAYHFVRFRTADEAQAEANHFAQIARQVGLSSNTLMIADVESVPQTRYAGIVGNLNVFWNVLSSLGYTNHGVYTGLSYDQQYNVSSTVGKARTWVAKYYLDYSANDSRDNYMAGLGYGAWQYTDRWNGIDGTIDFGMFRNYANGVTHAASLDNFNINASDNTLNVSGWFADNQNVGKNNRYVLLLDQDNGNREIGRQQVSAINRQDVAVAYPDIYGAAESGFNASFQINGDIAKAIANGHRIVAIIRYTSSSDGNSDFNDNWFDGVSFDENAAYLDSLQTTSAGVHVSGW